MTVWTPDSSPDSAFQATAGILGNTIYHMYAQQERGPDPDDEWRGTRRNRPRQPANREPSPLQLDNRPSSCRIRPTEWKGREHSSAVVAVWTGIMRTADAAEKAGVKEVVPIKSPEGENAEDEDEEVAKVKRKLAVADEVMKMAFPTLGQGNVPLSTEWIEFVLGVEGVEPFSTQEWKVKAAMRRGLQKGTEDHVDLKAGDE